MSSARSMNRSPMCLPQPAHNWLELFCCCCCCCCCDVGVCWFASWFPLLPFVDVEWWFEMSGFVSMAIICANREKEREAKMWKKVRCVDEEFKSIRCSCGRVQSTFFLSLQKLRHCRIKTSTNLHWLALHRFHFPSTLFLSTRAHSSVAKNSSRIYKMLWDMFIEHIAEENLWENFSCLILRSLNCCVCSFISLLPAAPRVFFCRLSAVLLPRVCVEIAAIAISWNGMKNTTQQLRVLHKVNDFSSVVKCLKTGWNCVARELNNPNDGEVTEDTKLTGEE